jgi:arsenate reductase
MSRRARIVFLCTGNSCRSQMAEGLLRDRFGDRVESLSAGTRPAGEVHPLAVRAMAEVGIDLTGQRPKTVLDLGPGPFHLALTVCDNAREACPSLPGALRQEHLGFPDPADAEGTEEERMAVFRRVRDEIAAAVAELEARLEALVAGDAPTDRS